MSLLEVLARSDADPDWQTQTLAAGHVVVYLDTNNNPTPFPPNPQSFVPSSKSLVWGFAICVSVGIGTACVLVSEKGDMRWTKITSDKVVIVGKASAAAMDIANTRLTA